MIDRPVNTIITTTYLSQVHPKPHAAHSIVELPKSNLPPPSLLEGIKEEQEPESEQQLSEQDDITVTAGNSNQC